jgi:hypothetical protein
MATPHPIQAALQAAVDDGTFPGAVLAVRLRGALVYEGAPAACPRRVQAKR